jgi:hypothetical protein
MTGLEQRLSSAVLGGVMNAISEGVSARITALCCAAMSPGPDTVIVLDPARVPVK